MGNIDLSNYNKEEFYGYGIGELYFEDVDENSIVEKNENKIADTTTKNYHFYPKDEDLIAKWNKIVSDKYDEIIEYKKQKSEYEGMDFNMNHSQVSRHNL